MDVSDLTRPSWQVHLDWVAYFRKFCEAHGEPVQYKGRLLFQDGWTYSKTNPAGPEWPPPEDEQEFVRLVRAYWLIKLRFLETESKQLDNYIRALSSMSDFKSVPLQQITLLRDAKDKKVKRTVSDLDLQMMKGRLADIDAQRLKIRGVVKQLGALLEPIKVN